MSAPSLPSSWPGRDADHLLVTGAQMADLERQLFDSGLPVEALMEKAALGVSRRLLGLLREATPGGKSAPRTGPAGGVVVLVGPGHNGGDGLVVARELHLAGVEVRIWSPFERRKPLTEAHWRHARWLGIPRIEGSPDPTADALWIDALFGIGQSRPPSEEIGRLLGDRQRCRPGALVAIDGPTGVCADSGRLLGEHAATAAVTYSIGLIKQGFLQDGALAFVGRLERIDLGLPEVLLQALPSDQPLALGHPDVVAADQASAPWAALDPSTGKYGRGRVLLVAGSDLYRGAAHLAVLGASASGCGSLKAALPEVLARSFWQLQPHVVLQPPQGVAMAGGLPLAALPADWLERLDALLLGPGIGPRPGPGGEGDSLASSGEIERWRQMRDFAGLLVLDADALNRLAGGAGDGPEAETAAGWLRGRAGPTWITPHRGEFDRLFPDLAGLPALEAAREASGRSGATVLLKGARSVVACPDGRRWQLAQACPQAARAGLGDVLAGFAAGKGAMAVAAARQAGGGPEADGSVLAAAALAHALAGWRCRRMAGPGGANPAAVAEALSGEA